MASLSLKLEDVDHCLRCCRKILNMKKYCFPLLLFLLCNGVRISLQQDCQQQTDVYDPKRLWYEEVARNWVETMIAGGKDIDADRILLLAAKQGYTKVLAILLGRGANINSQIKWGQTALMEAVEYGKTETVAFSRARGDLPL